MVRSNKFQVKFASVIIAGILIGLSTFSFAQTTAMNFNRPDCNGNMRHLFDDLDAGNAVIIEFFMQSCSSCIEAGDALEAMKTDLLAQFPGKIKSYAIGYNNTYSCSSNANWVSSNSYTSIPMDSGATQVAYYGGMGMPTIVILGGGTAHSVLGNPYDGFDISDTATMASDIRAFLNPSSGMHNVKSGIEAFQFYPHPSNDLINLSGNIIENSQLKIDIIDITGKQVAALINEKVNAGFFKKSFSSSSLPNGSYLIRVNINETVTNYKLSIVH